MAERPIRSVPNVLPAISLMTGSQAAHVGVCNGHDQGIVRLVGVDCADARPASSRHGISRTSRPFGGHALQSRLPLEWIRLSPPGLALGECRLPRHLSRSCSHSHSNARCALRTCLRRFESADHQALYIKLPPSTPQRAAHVTLCSVRSLLLHKVLLSPSQHIHMSALLGFCERVLPCCAIDCLDVRLSVTSLRPRRETALSWPAQTLPTAHICSRS